MSYTREQVENTVKSKGYFWKGEQKDLLINIIGIRNVNFTDNDTTNFDDNLVISFKENNVWILKTYPVSLRPGGTEILNFFSLYFGIDLLNNSVFNWQLGSKTFKLQSDFEEFMSICKSSRLLNGDNSFTFTTINSDEL